MPIYMKYGTTIKGDSLAEGHEGTKGWIEIDSVHFGTARNITLPTGSESDRGSSAPSISEIVITKQHDSTSTALFKESLQGEGATVVIEFVRTGSDHLETYLTFKLTKTLISSYNLSGSGREGAAPRETLTLNFTKIEYTTQGFNDDGTADPTKKGLSSYDLAQATK